MGKIDSKILIVRSFVLHVTPASLTATILSSSAAIEENEDDDGGGDDDDGDDDALPRKFDGRLRIRIFVFEIAASNNDDDEEDEEDEEEAAFTCPLA